MSLERAACWNRCWYGIRVDPTTRAVATHSRRPPPGRVAVWRVWERRHSNHDLRRDRLRRPRFVGTTDDDGRRRIPLAMRVLVRAWPHDSAVRDRRVSRDVWHAFGTRDPTKCEERRCAREPGRSLSDTAPSLAHTLDETLQDGEPVVPDLRVAEVDTDDSHQLRGRRRPAGREETLVALREAGLTRAGHQPGGEQERESVGVVCRSARGRSAAATPTRACRCRARRSPRRPTPSPPRPR